jgi:NAD(P)H-hydrate epimerase
VLTVAEMTAADRAAAALGVPSLALMEAAGAAVTREIQKRWPKQHVVVLCGPGNNGGDGFVIARLLFHAGWPVKVALLGEASALSGDAAENARRWHALCLSHPLTDSLFDPRPLVVDALFGAGLNRGLTGAAARAVARIAALGLTCVAVDVPSGVHGDTGLVLSGEGGAGIAPQCALTVTFFRPKPAHLLYPGRALCGEVIVADIGIPAVVLDTIQPRMTVNGPGLWTLPRPDWQSHKYTRGHLVVFAGRDLGAAKLAGQAARKVGAGLLTYAASGKSLGLFGDQPGAMIRANDTTADLDELLSDHRKNAAVIGPGLGVGPATCNLVLRLLSSSRALVLDADALTSFSADPQLLFDAVRARSAPTVLTPHEGEFARLFGAKGPRLARAKAASATSNSIVVLKGPDTLIAAPDGRVAINTNGSAWLATGGSGDVLAGVIGGLMGQGMTAWHATVAGVWLHAEAARDTGPGLIAEDLSSGLIQSIKTIIS